MTRRRTVGAVLLAALVALLVGLLTPASAAQLGITARPITLAEATGCTTSAITGTAGAATGTTATTVVLSGVPAACQGKVATLRLYAADGTALATTDTSVTLTTTGTTVTVPSYTVSRAAGVALTIGTWGVPVTWVVPAGSGGPVTPGAGTSFGTLQWTLVNESGSQACVVVPVSGAAGTVWQIDLHLDQRPFNGLTTGSGFVLSDYNTAKLVSTTPQNGILSVVGKPGWETLKAGQTLSISICNWNLPFPAYDPALTYTQTLGAVTGDRWTACLPVTVGVTGTPQFYAGWRTDVDVTPLLEYIRARQGTPVPSSLYNQNTGDVDVVALGGTVYRVQPKSGWGARGIRDDSPVVLNLCMRGT